MSHPPLPHRAKVPSHCSPLLGGACAASSMRSHSRLALIDAAAVVQTRHACPWSSPVPIDQRCFCPMKDSSRCQRDLIATLAALLPALVHQLISFFIPASRTSESIGPTTSCEIPLAGFLRAKVGLELAERLRERRSWHRLTLPIGAC